MLSNAKLPRGSPKSENPETLEMQSRCRDFFLFKYGKHPAFRMPLKDRLQASALPYADILSRQSLDCSTARERRSREIGSRFILMFVENKFPKFLALSLILEIHAD